MSRNRSTASVVAILLACVIASCVNDNADETVLGPGIAEPDPSDVPADSTRLSTADSTLLANEGFYWIKAPPVTTPRSVLDRLVQSVEATVSLDLGALGGTLKTLDHTVTVPEGTVKQPTRFTITVLQTGYVEVDLSATPKSVVSKILNIGTDNVPFGKPVTVTLSYARATNVVDPSRLKIMRLNADGTREILQSRVDTDARTVSVDLNHFSRYCMIAD